MRKIFFLLAGIVTSALTISCSEEGTGRRPGTDDGYIEIYENPNWKISADAAGLSAEVSVKSISNEYYYMDVIRLNEFTSTFGSDMKKYLQDEARMVRQQAEQENKSFNEFVSRGSSSVTFRDLTAESWVAVAFGMNKDWTLTGAYVWTTFDIDKFVLTLNPSWKIKYDGRKVDTQDGVSQDVDVIKVESSDGKDYCLDVVMAKDLKSWYNNDLAQYIQDEPNYYNGDIYNGGMELLFDRMRSGDWKAVAYGVTPKGMPTGEYAVLDYTVKPETASAEFNRWLDAWKFSGKDSKGNQVSYDINISSVDPNYIFKVEGWETGSQSEQPMDSYSFETVYNRFSDRMLFNGLYLETYQDNNNKDVDFCFYGNFDFNGEQLVLTDGLTIAEAALANDGNQGTISGCSFDYIENNKTYPSTFKSMQYMDLPVSSDEVLIYNSNVPLFPITMTRSTSGRSISTASAHSTKVLRVRPARHVRGNASVTSSKARRNPGTRK